MLAHAENGVGVQRQAANCVLRDGRQVSPRTMWEALGRCGVSQARLAISVGRRAWMRHLGGVICGKWSPPQEASDELWQQKKLQPKRPRLPERKVSVPVPRRPAHATELRHKNDWRAAKLAACTFQDTYLIWRELIGHAKAGEPWAIHEYLNRIEGMPGKGPLGHAVEEEIANRINVESLSDEELRALADILAKMHGTPESSLGGPDIIEAGIEALPGAGSDRLAAETP